jgi:hypothetical protein
MTGAETTVAGAILRHREAFLSRHPACRTTRRLLALLPLCRTSALGGHLHRCGDCGHEQPRYNPCGNRHCPACQTAAREKWVAKQEEALLPLPYFHLVFTLPAELQLPLLQNKEEGYNLLFQSAAKTLQRFGADPRHGLEGQLGFTAVLHTWSQTLSAHAHLHVLIPAGALSKDRRVFRVVPNSSWLFPVRAVSKVFRAIFLDGWERRSKAGKLRFHGNQADWSDPAILERRCRELRGKEWVVYAKKPFAGPSHVVRYLGRYTHRVAISNARIQDVGETVRFEYRDRKDPSRKKTMELPGPEFLRRFFLHTLPPGFTKIRHYGFLANNGRAANLSLIRDMLDAGESPRETERSPASAEPARRPPRCPRCETGILQVAGMLSPNRSTGPPPK